MSHFLRAAAHARAPGHRNTLLLEQRLGILVVALALLFVGAQSAFAHEFKVGDLEIEHPWSRATPAGAKVGGGYFTVTNKGSAPDRLLSISSDISDKAELHEMGVKDGVMTMRPVSGGLEIPAGGKTAKAQRLSLMFSASSASPQAGRSPPHDLRKPAYASRFEGVGGRWVGRHAN